MVPCRLISNVDSSGGKEHSSVSLPSYEEMLRERKKLEDDLTTIIKFEELLANITTKPQDSNSLKSYTIDKMTQDFPFLNWTSFFNSAFKAVTNGTEDQITPETEVLVQVDFLRGVNILVQKYQSTSEGRTILRNYLIWRLVAAFYPERPVEEIPRKERCLKETEEIFAPSITAMYVEAKGVKKSKDVVDQVRSILGILFRTIVVFSDGNRHSGGLPFSEKRVVGIDGTVFLISGWRNGQDHEIRF